MNAAVSLSSGSFLKSSELKSSQIKSSALTHYPFSGSESGNPIRLYAQPLVLLHGWGMDSQIWQSLPQQLSQFADVITVDLPGFGQSPPLADYDKQSLYQWLAAVLPERCYLMGLSLGGMLACGFAAGYPDRIQGLVTVSSNSCFVASATYAAAMDSQQFESFVTSWNDNRDSCLKRFIGLQAQGDQHQRQLMRDLRAMPLQLDPKSGEQLLRLLGEIDNRDALRQLRCPTLALFGDSDALVPAVSAETSVSLNSKIEVVSIEGAGHLPHLSQPGRVVELISTFLERHHYALDKSKIADSFGRAANKYDRAAQLQHQVGEGLIAALTPNPTLTHIIDLGCGTGYHCSHLQRHFPGAQLTGIDLSAAMLTYAAQRHISQAQCSWICGDAEDLPLDDQSQQLIFSNFALQWCENLPRLAGELYRVLRPGGELCFAVPGPQTLAELRSAWQQVDGLVHVNRFYDLQTWQQALQQAGFNQLELNSEIVVQEHSSVRELLMELKDVGAHNNNAGKQSTLTGKQHLKALYDAYEPFRLAAGTIPASWEIIRVRAIK